MATEFQEDFPEVSNGIRPAGPGGGQSVNLSLTSEAHFYGCLRLG